MNVSVYVGLLYHGDGYIQVNIIIIKIKRYHIILYYNCAVRRRKVTESVNVLDKIQSAIRMELSIKLQMSKKNIYIYNNYTTANMTEKYSKLVIIIEYIGILSFIQSLQFEGLLITSFVFITISIIFFFFFFKRINV